MLPELRQRQLRADIEAEVNATIKLIMASMEDLAALPPEVAGDPIVFNDRRHLVIRKIWNLTKECMRYGASSVQPDQLR
jgi:hypothetical protein